MINPNIEPYYADGTQNSIDSTAKRRIIQGIFDLIGMAICFIAFAIVYAALKPRERYFTCDMSDISFPYIGDTIPFYAVGIYGIIGPLIVILLVELINSRMFPCQDSKDEPLRFRLRRFFINLFHAVSLFVFGISIVLLLTEIGKRWIGRLRPHFLTVCAPTYNTITCTSNALVGTIYNSISTGGSFCTGNSKDIEEARLSFPSGHASFSSYTMLYLIMYLEARYLSLKFRYLKALVQVTAFITAYVTAISRIPDYHHRGSDVIGGIVIGAGVALFMTLVIGKVLWIADKNVYYDFDEKPGKTQNVANPNSPVILNQYPIQI